MIFYLVILAGAATKVYSSLWQLFNLREKNRELYLSPFVKYIWLKHVKVNMRFSLKFLEEDWIMLLGHGIS